MTNVATDLPITSPYASIDDAIQAFVALEQIFRAGHDRRAIFVTAYLSITRAIKQSVEAGLFQDNAWATRYAICFANLYRTALLAYERGDWDALPKAWRISSELQSTVGYRRVSPYHSVTKGRNNGNAQLLGEQAVL